MGPRQTARELFLHSEAILRLPYDSHVFAVDKHLVGRYWLRIRQVGGGRPKWNIVAAQEADPLASVSTFQELERLSAASATDAGNANKGDARGFELLPEEGEE